MKEEGRGRARYAPLFNRQDADGRKKFNTSTLVQDRNRVLAFFVTSSIQRFAFHSVPFLQPLPRIESEITAPRQAVEVARANANVHGLPTRHIS